MGMADAFTHGKEQHFLVPPPSHIPMGCAQPSYSGLEKMKKEPPQLGFKEKRKSKYQR
jgi:hypothetical protein